MLSKRSLRFFSPLLALAVAGVQSAFADPSPAIVPITSNLPLNATNYQLQFMVTGTDAIMGEELNFQINAGSVFPTIGGVDILTGTIFAANNFGQFDLDNGGNNHLAYTSTFTNSGVVVDNGILATLLVTTGASSGTFKIDLMGTPNGNSVFRQPDGTPFPPFYLHDRFTIGSPDRVWTHNTGGTWGDDTNWNPFAPYTIGDPANFFGALATSGAVTLDGNRIAGSINFNNVTASYTIAQGTGPGSITLNNGASVPAITDAGGNHTISVPITLTANTNLSVTNAGDSITLSGAVSGPSYNLSLSGLGKSIFSGAVIHNVGAISGAGNLQVDGGTTLQSAGVSLAGTWTINATHQIKSGLGNAGTSKVNAAPTIPLGAGGGQLDLTDSRLIVQSTGIGTDKTNKIAAINADLIAASGGSVSHGYGLAWGGKGITSSSISAPLAYGIGVWDNAIPAVQAGASAGGLFGGQSVDNNSILVHIAHIGDADGSGLVNIIDLSIVANAWQQPANNWGAGDLNGDGIVNIVDFTMVANNWQQTSTFPLTADDSSGMSSPSFGGAAAVPEPTSLALLAVGGATLLTRRRRISTHA